MSTQQTSKNGKTMKRKKRWTIGRMSALETFALALVVSVTIGAACQSVVHAAEAKLEPIHEIIEPPAPADPSKFGKVAVVQWAPYLPTAVGVTVEQAEAFKQQNRETMARFVREAASKGAKLIVTSEFSIVGYPDIPEVPAEEDEYRNREDIRPYVETVPGPSTEYFGKLAKELGVYIQFGFAERDAATDAYYNVAVAVDPQGAVIGKYRKINLYQGETNFLSPGAGTGTYLTPFGKVGMIICADVYSTEPMTSLISQKVDVLALSTSWAQMNTGMTYFTRGAKRAKAYLLAANQTYFPDSGVINPDGKLQSHIRQTEGIAYGYLPLKAEAVKAPVQQNPIRK